MNVPVSSSVLGAAIPYVVADNGQGRIFIFLGFIVATFTKHGAAVVAGAVITERERTRPQPALKRSARYGLSST